MKKIKFLGLLIVIFGLFFSVKSGLMNVDAFTFTTVCQAPLTTFSDNSSTFDISFPPGGGTTCDTVTECPKIKLLDGTTIFSIKVDMELIDPTSEIGTPYIWVPRTGSGQISQLRISDASIVKSYNVISNPSRVTVMPGGDVWMASRKGSGVSRLSPLMGNPLIIGGGCGTTGDGLCGGDENIYSCPADCTGNFCGVTGILNCEEYEITGTYVASGEAKGITYGSDGNIYVGDYDSANMTKFTYSGGAIVQSNFVNTDPTYHHVYGMIGDPYGYVWMIVASSNASPGNSNRRVIYFDTNTGIFGAPISCTLNGNNHLYGIGMDNEGNVLANNYGGGGTCKIGGKNSGFFGNVITTYIGPAGSRGVAVDGNNNVWVSNSANNNVYVYNSAGTLLQTIATGFTDVLGVAIDFDNNAWVASNGSGHITQYGAVGSASEYLVLNDRNMGGVAPKLYNYSDMTGLRTVPKTIAVGSSGRSIPLSGTGTFEICSDPLAPPLCSDSTICDALILPTSCGDPSGFCEIPLEIFSMQVGDYTLKNLEVVYGKRTPITTGGLVPCGRDWDDPNTPGWDERDPCSFCFLIMLLNQIANFLLQIASVIAILAFVITGFLFITSSGDPERRNLAKTSFKWIIVGFLIIFLSWLFIDFILSAWGYLDPLGGEWEVVCD